MIRKMVAAVLLAGTMSSSVLAQDFYMHGLGNQSCATVMRPDSIHYAEEWALGFFTARNVDQQAVVGMRTDRAAIVATLKKYCDDWPSDILASAAMKVYASLVAKGL